MSHAKLAGETFLSSVLDFMLDAACVVDRDGRFVFVSAAGQRIFGYAPVEMLGRPILDFVHPEDRARTLQAVDEIISLGPKPHFENRYIRKDGTVVHIMWSAPWSEVDQVRVAVARDVTHQRRAEQLQSALQGIVEAAEGTTPLAVLMARAHDSVHRTLAVTRFEVRLHEEGQVHPVAADVEANAIAQQVQRARRTIRRERDGHEWLGMILDRRDVVLGSLVVRGAQGQRYSDYDLALLHDVAARVASIVERQRAALGLQRAARHDPLTDLPNRLLLGERMQTALVRAQQDGTKVAVLYLDLDRFKEVNDELGHAVGDQLLQEVARRLKSCVRDSDTVARIGGDEFVVLLCHLRVTDHALVVAEKIRAALSRPYSLSGNTVRITPSIGVASYPEHGAAEAELLARADAAMYRSKRDGGNRASKSAAGVPEA